MSLKVFVAFLNFVYEYLEEGFIGIFDFSLGDYAQVFDTFCRWPDAIDGKEYATTESAKAACDNSSSCEAFYTERGDKYFSCPLGSTVKKSKGYKLFKKGNLIEK